MTATRLTEKRERTRCSSHGAVKVSTALKAEVHGAVRRFESGRLHERPRPADVPGVQRGRRERGGVGPIGRPPALIPPRDLVRLLENQGPENAWRIKRLMEDVVKIAKEAKSLAG